jgi:hypothetical protein
LRSGDHVILRRGLEILFLIGRVGILARSGGGRSGGQRRKHQQLRE